MILAGNVADEIYPFTDLIFDALSPESILKTDKGRSSDLFPPCGLPTLRAVTIENARSVMKLTATGIVSDFHRSSLFILGD